MHICRYVYPYMAIGRDIDINRDIFMHKCIDIRGDCCTKGARMILLAAMLNSEEAQFEFGWSEVWRLGVFALGR